MKMAALTEFLAVLLSALIMESHEHVAWHQYSMLEAGRGWTLEPGNLEGIFGNIEGFAPNIQ